MKQRNVEIRNQILEDVAIFRAVRRSDVVMQIREQMRQHGIRTSDIAERLGVSDANVSRWLRGDQNLKIDTLYLLAEAAEAAVAITVKGVGRASISDFKEDPCESTAGSHEAGQPKIFDATEESTVAAVDSKVVDYSRFCKFKERSSKPKPPFHEPQSGVGLSTDAKHILAA